MKSEEEIKKIIESNKELQQLYEELGFKDGLQKVVIDVLEWVLK